LSKRGYRLHRRHRQSPDAGGSPCPQREFTGAEAEKALEAAGIITNKNAILNDPRPPKVTSGLRLGTPAVTTRGLKERDLESVADFIDRALLGKNDPAVLSKIRGEVAEFCKKFPMPH
jgi:glycine hydroxymethyltransferase